MLKRALEAGLEKRGRTRMRGTAKTMGLLDKGPKNPNGTMYALLHPTEQCTRFYILRNNNITITTATSAAGSLSLAELTQHLDPKEVSYGMLRMGFGSGLFRRTKWVLFFFFFLISKWVNRRTYWVILGRFFSRRMGLEGWHLVERSACVGHDTGQSCGRKGVGQSPPPPPPILSGSNTAVKQESPAHHNENV
ncbi:hypothetical protein T492DRAFT_1145430 [Pavlovales sp. CCMP2436]|nr:hypothetical protein T492DRAFT_1145430 [Pavlovales sp. CCMP2436]